MSFFSCTISFSPSAKQSITLQAGYYNGGTLDSTSAYNQGYNQGVTDADGRANPSSANYQSGRAQGQADVINNPKGYGISANSNNYSEQTVSMSRSRDEYKNNPTIIVTFSNLTRVDAIVDCRPGAGDGYSPSGSNYFKIVSGTNTVEVCDTGSGDGNGNQGNHYITVTARQYHAFD